MLSLDQRVTQVLPVVDAKSQELPTVAPSRSPSPLNYSTRIPSKIGRYELMYHIASGGMASVYAGRLSGMAGFERLVAIKVIHPHLADERSFVEMFLDEARLVARIVHPNVAEIHEVGEDNGIYYMVGELVQGKDLRQIAQKADDQGVLLSPDATVKLMIHICDGLQDAHDLTDANGNPLRLVHRDISTRNIMLSYKGHPKLIDFGAAWAESRLTNTTNGVTKGKIGYMAPEQLRGEAIDCRADIYALGVVLFTMVAGRHPFPYENEGEQINKAIRGDFVSPRLLNPEIHPELESIILKSMSNEPGDRYSSAAEMGIELSNYLHANGSTKPGALYEMMTTLFHGEAKEELERIKDHRLRSTTTDAFLSTKTSGVELAVESIPEGVGSKRRIIKLSGILVGAIAVLLMFAYVTDRLNQSGKSQQLSADRKSSQKPGLQSVGGKAAEEESVYPKTDYPNLSATTAKTVVVNIEGSSPDAIFWIDGQRRESPFRLRKSRQVKKVLVETPGYESAELEITPFEDQVVKIELPLKVHPDAASKKIKRKKRRRRTKLTSAKTNKSDTSKSSTDSGLAFEKNPFSGVNK